MTFSVETMQQKLLTRSHCYLIRVRKKSDNLCAATEYRYNFTTMLVNTRKYVDLWCT